MFPLFGASCTSCLFSVNHEYSVPTQFFRFSLSVNTRGSLSLSTSRMSFKPFASTLSFLYPRYLFVSEQNDVSSNYPANAHDLRSVVRTMTPLKCEPHFTICKALSYSQSYLIVATIL